MKIVANCLRLGVVADFLAQKFNRRTALEPTTKLSYEALHPPLRQTAVGCWPSVFRVVSLLVVHWDRHTLCQVLAFGSAGATWQCVWLLGWLIFLSLLYQLLLVSLSCLRRVLFVSWCLLSKAFQQFLLNGLENAFSGFQVLS